MRIMQATIRAIQNPNIIPDIRNFWPLFKFLFTISICVKIRIAYERSNSGALRHSESSLPYIKGNYHVIKGKYKKLTLEEMSYGKSLPE